MDTARKDAERQSKIDEAYASLFGGGEQQAPSEGHPTPPQAQPRAGMFDPQKLRGLMALGPEGLQAAKSLMEMDEAQVKAAKARVEQDMDLKGRIIGGIRALPAAQRQAAYDDAKARLAEQGVNISRLPEQWDENFADQMIRESLEVAKVLEMEDKARDFAEKVRHNRATEAVAVTNAQTAKGRLGVSQGALGLARERAAKGAGAGSDDDLGYLLGGE